jgi:ABC-type transport system involved in Fe-S cluster assembly fused permease/ATPase subunit
MMLWRNKGWTIAAFAVALLEVASMIAVHLTKASNWPAQTTYLVWAYVMVFVIAMGAWRAARDKRLTRPHGDAAMRSAQ